MCLVSCMFVHTRPSRISPTCSWSDREHEIFVDAMETWSLSQSGLSSTEAWEAMAEAVPNKTVQDVKMHALLYLHMLNMETDGLHRTMSGAETQVEGEESGNQSDFSDVDNNSYTVSPTPDTCGRREITAICVHRKPEEYGKPESSKDYWAWSHDENKVHEQPLIQVSQPHTKISDASLTLAASNSSAQCSHAHYRLCVCLFVCVCVCARAHRRMICLCSLA